MQHKKILLFPLLLTLAFIAGCTLQGADPAPTSDVPLDDGGGVQPTQVPVEPTTAEDVLPTPEEQDSPDVFATQTAIAGDTGGEATVPPADDEGTPMDNGEMPEEGEPTDDGMQEPTDDGMQEPTAEGGEGEPTAEPPAATEVPEVTEAPEATQPPTTGGGECTYVVQPGDNLFRIAMQYEGVSVDELAAFNGITNPALIQVGTELEIPSDNCVSSGGGEGSSGEVYIVQPGDTLFRIALNNGLTVDELASFNNISDPSQIAVGQEINIPPSGE